MELKRLKQFVASHNNYEMRVITHAGSRFYQAELEDSEGERHMLTQGTKPMLFRCLDDAYMALKRAGIHRAYLVQHVPHDEMIGRDAHYSEPLTSRMPLVF